MGYVVDTVSGGELKIYFLRGTHYFLIVECFCTPRPSGWPAQAWPPRRRVTDRPQPDSDAPAERLVHRDGAAGAARPGPRARRPAAIPRCCNPTATR